MSQSRYILVHDLGTTGIKATLFDAAGATVATAFCLISSANGAPIGIPWLWHVCGAHDVARPGRDRGRAVLEGVACNLKMILDAFLEQGAVIRATRLIGGARSALWRQILVDIYGLPILRPALLAEATSLGAAIAGGVGVGLFPDFRVAHELVQVEEGEQPNPAPNQRYTALYGLFQQTHTALEPIFEQLATLAK